MSEGAAIAALSSILALQPTRSMKLSSLALPRQSNWVGLFKDNLGPIKEFIRAHSQIFHIHDCIGAGNDVITLIRPPVRPPGSPMPVAAATQRAPDQYALPRPSDDLWRPFDRLDSFVNDPERFDRIRTACQNYWLRYFNPGLVNSPLYNMSLEDAKVIYEQAFNKCTRLTIGISFVVARDLTARELRDEFEKHAMAVGDREVRLFLWKDEMDRGRMYSETFATVWGPGRTGNRPLNALANVVDALNFDLLQFMGKTLRLYCVGYAPVWISVTRGIHEILRVYAAATPVPPSPVVTPPPAQEPDSEPAPTPADPVYVPPLPAAPLLPRQVSYDALYRPVIEPDSPHLSRARAFLANKERLLRQRCAEQRKLSKDDQDLYDDRYGLEWMGGEDFTLGSGREATIYMGLLRDVGAETSEDDASTPGREPERLLVAVKHCNVDNPFQSQEMDHYVSMKKQPGIAQYYKGFVVKYGPAKYTILVQELGLCSLRKLLTGDESMKLPPYVLNADEKFKLTKALCMAVHELHALTPSITHRDIRPENVLVMPNGTIALTDFGLARRAPHRFKGSSVHIKNRLTTMQPHEVQVRFQEDVKAIQEIPVEPTADVFMLGLVIAYVHLGFDPYEDDGPIMTKQAPNLGTRLEHEQPWLYHLLTRMLDHDSERRPSMENVLRHPYFCTWSENFDVSLITRVENVIVADYHPVDNKLFRTLEALLEPIEREMADAAEKWHQKLPRNLFEGKGRLPNVDNGDTALQFHANGAIPPRAYPLPNVAQFVKWVRNVRTHCPSSPVQQDALRRSRAALTGITSDYYETVGDFFLQHPAVQWFLPKLWERSVDLLQACYRDQRALKVRHEEELRRFEEEKQKLEDQHDALDAFLTKV